MRIDDRYLSSRCESSGTSLAETYLPSDDEGKRLCQAFVGDDPARFTRLLTEQLTTRRPGR